jgi:hypothetical protein
LNFDQIEISEPLEPGIVSVGKSRCLDDHSIFGRLFLMVE